MKNYIIKRVLTLIPVFLGISILIFCMVRLTPGDPYGYLVDSGMSVEDKEQMLNEIGYYDPLPVQYGKWLSRAVHGDLGMSIRYKEPVLDVLMRRMKNTLLLSITALFLSVLIAVPLGVISATKHNSIFDYVATCGALIGLSIPAFFFALGVIKIFAFDLQWFPNGGMQTINVDMSAGEKILDIIYHMVLPVFVLTCMQTASFMRYTRSAMMEVLTQDFIRTARAKGHKERLVVYRHGLSNALISITTLITISIGHLLSGAVLTETIFSWPGMGTLMYQAISNRDYPLITGGALLLSVCVLLANMLADILYVVVDPRIKYEGM